MSMLDLSPKDVMRDTVIDPAGWYQVRIDTVLDGAPSRDGQSINIGVEGTILKNADLTDEASSKKYEGYPTPRWFFNSKVPSFAVGLLRAAGEEVVPGRVNLKVLEGKIIEVFIKHGEYNGKSNCEVDHQYRAAR